MKHWPHAFSLILFLCFVKLLSAQDSTEFLFTKAELAKDVEILSQAFNEIHPKFIDTDFQEKMQKQTNVLLQKLNDSISSSAFHILISKHYVRYVECGHTVAIPSESWYLEQATNSLALPFNVYIMGQKMYVKRSLDKDSVLQAGDEILSINKRTAAEIIQDMRDIRSRDQKALNFVNVGIENLFRTYHLFLYGGSESYEIAYKNQEGLQQVNISSETREKVKSKPKAYLDSNLVQRKLDGPDATFYLLNSHENTAILDINSFASRKYKKFYKEVFKSLDQQAIENLIIDLRGNGGGYFLNGNELLSYLLNENFDLHVYKRSKKIPKGEHYTTPRSSKLTMRAFNLMPDRDKDDPRRNYRFKKKIKKKNLYRKQIYVLTDGYSFSLSSYVSSVLEEKTEAVFVGTETGGGAAGSNAIIMYLLVLPNSGVRVKIPHFHLDHQRLSPSERGVVPDYPIEYSLNDRLMQKDKELEFVFKMIGK